MEWRVPLFDPDLGQSELDGLTQVIRSKWLTMGEMTNRFESEFAKFTGSRHGIAVNSCTAALHLALAALDVGPGDEVICPSLTFVATANAIRYCGATPVFAEVASQTDWNVSRATLEQRITPRTKAIVVVHYAGFPCDMAEISALARERKLGLVEDVAHAPGGEIGGKRAGAWSDVGCFSFFSNKNMTTGEGGMMTTDRDDLADKLKKLRSHGMTTLTLDRHKGHAFSYDVVALGYNYRMSELNAALGLAQLPMLQSRNEARRRLVERYRGNLRDAGIEIPFINSRGVSTHHLFPVLLPKGCGRNALMAFLRDRGVQSSIHYRPVDTFTAYREAGLGPCEYLELTHQIGEREVTLPLYPSMTAEQVDFVCDSLKSALAVKP